MISNTVTLCNKAGLHARAAAKLVELSAGFASDIKIGHEKMVDGKSILSLMMLAAINGTELNIVADGPDEEKAMDAITTLIQNRFGEEE